ncbi:hypothetical protein SAMN04488065_1184 [Haloplanus vescus]|uniref:Uncharacterized protein n=1 Tax=Haloplanus vescus TaxID=555874 RepID=A0A1H3WX59_9EURY|nr:hypothetical protein [Haloplanus vescus]SDZ91301.1 hypothetical protein SAMN04488065_1184 [Haloplanus vescus]
MVVLQVNLATVPQFYFVLFVVVLVTIAMGSFVVYQAYQGYRRHGGRRMLFLAVGIGLITVVPPLLAITVASVGLRANFSLTIYTYHVPLAENIIKIIGLAFIIYSLALPSQSS